MASVFYDFDAITNGAGTSMSVPKNAWASPSAGDVIYLKPGQTWTRATQVTLTAANLTFMPWPTYYDDPSGGKPRIVHSAASTFIWSFTGDGVHKLRDLEFKDCSSNANGAMLGAGTVVATSVGVQFDLHGLDFSGISHHAVRMSATAAAASPTFKALYCTWDNIGEDAVYGGAVIYEVGFGRMTRLSMATPNGDGIGFLDATPTLAWVHDNYINHSHVDSKHCIIIDVPTAGTGYALIENNDLIGYGDESAPAATHTMINGDAVMLVRKNRMAGAGIMINMAGASSIARDNVMVMRNVRAASPMAIAHQVNNCKSLNNTIAFSNRAPTIRQGIAVALGITGSETRNNVIVGASVGMTAASSGGLPTRSNNAFWDCDVAAADASGPLAAGSGDVNSDPLLSASYRPMLGSPLLKAGAYLGPSRDIDGHKRPNPPSIGAYDVATLRRAYN